MSLTTANPPTLAPTILDHGAPGATDGHRQGRWFWGQHGVLEEVEAGVAFQLGVPGTPLVYDFAGFDRRWFETTYPTPDAAGLAARLAAAMPDSERSTSTPAAASTTAPGSR